MRGECVLIIGLGLNINFSSYYRFLTCSYFVLLVHCLTSSGAEFFKLFLFQTWNNLSVLIEP
jgi:hypothetical protein